MSMVSAREQALAHRRHMLLAQSAAHRAQIRLALKGLRPGIASADQFLQVGRWVRRHARWIGLAAGAMVALRRPRGLFRLAGKAWSVWRGMRVLGL